MLGVGADADSGYVAPRRATRREGSSDADPQPVSASLSCAGAASLAVSSPARRSDAAPGVADHCARQRSTPRRRARSSSFAAATRPAERPPPVITVRLQSYRDGQWTDDRRRPRRDQLRRPLPDASDLVGRGRPRPARGGRLGGHHATRTPVRRRSRIRAVAGSADRERGAFCPFSADSSYDTMTERNQTIFSVREREIGVDESAVRAGCLGAREGRDGGYWGARTSP